MTTTEKLETFASQLEGVFTNEIENNVFDEEVKTDVDAEQDQPIARARLNFQKVIPFDPDIHPGRIRFGEVTDILGKVNTRKACGPDHITTKIIRYLIPTLHIILQDLLNICVFHGYHPSSWKREWALMAHNPSKRRSNPCPFRPISLLCCLSKVFEAIMTERLMSWAENTDKLPAEQSRFRKHHSTNNKILELTQSVCQAQRLSTRGRHISSTTAYVMNCYTWTHPLCCSDGLPAFYGIRQLRSHIQGNCDQLWCSPRKPYQPSSFPSLHV